MRITLSVYKVIKIANSPYSLTAYVFLLIKKILYVINFNNTYAHLFNLHAFWAYIPLEHTCHFSNEKRHTEKAHIFINFTGRKRGIIY